MFYVIELYRDLSIGVIKDGFRRFRRIRNVNANGRSAAPIDYAANV